jgi:hypothetical protein
MRVLSNPNDRNPCRTAMHGLSREEEDLQALHISEPKPINVFRRDIFTEVNTTHSRRTRSARRLGRKIDPSKAPGALRSPISGHPMAARILEQRRHLLLRRPFPLLTLPEDPTLQRPAKPRHPPRIHRIRHCRQQHAVQPWRRAPGTGL